MPPGSIFTTLPTRRSKKKRRIQRSGIRRRTQR
jgi:hypothetical protein